MFFDVFQQAEQESEVKSQKKWLVAEISDLLSLFVCDYVKPNKYSLGISLLQVVPSTRSLVLKKIRYTLYAYVNEYASFYAFPWRIEQYRLVFTTESHVQRLDNVWITRLIMSIPSVLTVSQPRPPNLSKTAGELNIQGK